MLGEVYKCKIGIEFNWVVEDWAPWELVYVVNLGRPGGRGERERETERDVKPKLNFRQN